jgi:hypothetical protein
MLDIDPGRLTKLRVPGRATGFLPASRCDIPRGKFVNAYERALLAMMKPVRLTARPTSAVGHADP